MTHDGEKEVVRRQPFAHVKMTLAANHQPAEKYPSFDPLAIFSSEEAEAAPPVSRTGTLYGSDVESEVALKTVDFPLKGSTLKFAPSMSMDEVEENVRTNGSVLTDGNTQLASLFYIDPRRFASDASDLDLIQGPSARVVEENMTVSAFRGDHRPDHRICRRRHSGAPGNADRRRADQCRLQQGPGRGSRRLSAAGAQCHGICRKATCCASASSRRGENDEAKVVRASVYTRGAHVFTMALDDKGNFVKAYEPPQLAAVASAFDDNGTPVITSGHDLPRVYDGVYRAALSYGMNSTMIAQIIKLLASNVDFQAQLKPTDRLEAFFSVADDSGKATDDSELLYVNAKFGDAETRSTGSRIRTTIRSTITTSRARASASSCCAIRFRTARSAPASACAAIRSSASRACIPVSTGQLRAARRLSRPATASSKRPAGIRWLWQPDADPPCQWLCLVLQPPERHCQECHRRFESRTGPGDRLGRHHGPVDRTAPAL